MSWISFGNGIVAAAFLSALVAVCFWVLCVLGRKPVAFLVVFAVFSIVATIKAQKTNGVPPSLNSPSPQVQQGGVFLTGLTGLTGLSGLPSLVPLSQNLVNPVNPVQNNLPVQTTIDDIARGWRVECVATNAMVSYAMPANGTLVGNWHVHGARSSFGNNRIDFADWQFPLGTNGAAFSSFWYFADGRIRPTPKDAAHEICAVGAPMSAVPGQSRLWTAEEPDGSRVLTWENFFICGDTNVPVNAQIRLYPNGDFTTRSNDVETVCRRVNPDDWDDDGIPNDSDLNPLVCDGDFFGPANILPDGANTNAYCTVSLVATGPDTLVVFEGDGPSDYPDPRFVARHGETNEVLILIGKTYTVSSAWLIEFTGASDSATEIFAPLMRLRSSRPLRGENPQTHTVRRPVSISASDGNPFTMSVVPSNLGGVFSWNASDCGCSISGVGNTFSWNCSMSCTCCGTSADGWYSYEGYRLPATSCLCGCHYDGEGPTWEESTAPFAATVDVSFSKCAIIFENGYENLPGQWVGKNSTRTRLNLVATGGPNGSVLSIATGNFAKLEHISGPELPILPLTIPAGSQVAYSIVYEGATASDATDDIMVEASVAEFGFPGTEYSSDSMTAIRLELEPLWQAPANPCTNRHMYGVGEKVLFRVYPHLAEVTLSTLKQDRYDTYGYELFDGVATNDASAVRTYQGPISANYEPPITVSFRDVEYEPAMEFIEPKYAFTRGAEWGVCVRDLFYDGNRRCWPSGDVGAATLVTTNFIGPMTVSFRGIAVSELACYTEDIVTGSFMTGHSRTHTEAVGANNAYPIKEGNMWFVDAAGVSRVETDWLPDSEMNWRIPLGWHRRRDSEYPFLVPHADYEAFGDDTSRNLILAREYNQRFSIDQNGVFKIEKYGHWISRSRFCHVILDGTTLQWTHPLF